MSDRLVMPPVPAVDEIVVHADGGAKSVVRSRLYVISGLARVKKLQMNPAGDRPTVVTVGGNAIGAIGSEIVITKPHGWLPVSRPAPTMTRAPVASVPTL